MTHWQHIACRTATAKRSGMTLPTHPGRVPTGADSGWLLCIGTKKNDMTSDITIWCIYIYVCMWCDVMWCDMIWYDIYICIDVDHIYYMIHIYIYTWLYIYICIYTLYVCMNIWSTVLLYEIVPSSWPKKAWNREKRSVPQHDTPVESSKPPSGPLSALRLDTSS